MGEEEGAVHELVGTAVGTVIIPGEAASNVVITIEETVAQSDGEKE